MSAEQRAIYIKASAAVGPHADITAAQRHILTHDAEQPPLDGLRKEWCKQSLRQASRMVELGVVGAALLRRQLAAVDASGLVLYVATGLGELAKNNALFSQVLPPANGLASPFDFINSSANTTAFYVARDWDFNGRNLTLSANEFSFETAVQRAFSDLVAGDCSSAMVGGIDEYLGPRELHLDRLGLASDSDCVLGEGCGWLYLDRSADRATGKVLSLFELANHGPQTVTGWTQKIGEEMAKVIGDTQSCVLLPGSGIGPERIAELIELNPSWTTWDYLPFCGHFPTAAAFGIAASLEQDTLRGHTLVHINRDTRGKTVGVIYQRLT